MGWASDNLQYLVTGIAKGSIYAIIALGFSLIFSSTQIVNLAQGEFVMIGAMGTVFILHTVGGVPLVPAALAAIVLSALVGVALGGSIVHRLRSASAISLIIITVGASIALRSAAALFSLKYLGTKEFLPLPEFSQGASINLGGAFIVRQDLWIIGITALMVLLVYVFYEWTTFGKAMKAAAINKRGARLVGINVRAMVVWAFAISAALGAIGGIIVAPKTCAGYDMGTMLGLKGFCAAVFGGLGSGGGAILGGLALGIIESFGASKASSYQDAIAFIVLLLVLFVRPRGLLGEGGTDGR